MSKSRRKAGGCTRGRFRLKKMGKGWAALRKKRGSVKPVERKSDGGERGEGGEGGEANAEQQSS